MTATTDPMAAAMNPEPQDRTYFGEVVTADAWFVVLEKGVGKRVFDPTHDEVEKRRTAIKIEIDPLKGDYLIAQECLHFEPEWLTCTLPSLKKLNIELSSLQGKFVRAKRIPTGQTYTNKQGATKDKTGIVILEVFQDGATCIQAAEGFFGSKGEESLSPEQDFALKSLPALWKASGGDKTRFQTMIEQSPLVAKYYPWSHPTVQALIADDDLPF